MFRRKFVEAAGPTLAEKKLTLEISTASARRSAASSVSGCDEPRGWFCHGVACVPGLEQAALWGLLAGIFNSIPYYGPLIVSGGLSACPFCSSARFRARSPWPEYPCDNLD